jgi:hypothetical protein
MACLADGEIGSGGSIDSEVTCVGIRREFAIQNLHKFTFKNLWI